MADEYIKREDALNASKIVYIEYIEVDGEGYEEADANEIPVVFKKDLETIPTADVVKVVRCKDCKKYGTPYCAVDLWTKEITMRKATENGFCSFGERREVQDGLQHG